MSETILINRLPARTWNRLGVNETALTWDKAADLGTERITAAGQTARLGITGSGDYSEKTVEIHAPEGSARLTLNASGAGTELSAYAANGSRSRHIWFFPDGSTQTE